MRRRNCILTVCLLAASLPSCAAEEVSETPEYEAGYDEGFDAGYEEARAIYSARIEDAVASIENARVEVREAQDAARLVVSEAERFGFSDWQYVVGDVQSAADQAASETQDLDQHLDEAEGYLSE